MSLRMVVFALVAGLAFIACGPSAAQVKTARTARYQADASKVFQAAVAALAANDYKVAAADAVAGQAQTVPRWYEYDGTFVGKNARDEVLMKDQMINLTLTVSVVAEGSAFRVEVIPSAAQYRDGYSALSPLKDDDTAMTSWIAGKVDSVYLSIYDALKPSAVAPGT